MRVTSSTEDIPKHKVYTDKYQKTKNSTDANFIAITFFVKIIYAARNC